MANYNILKDAIADYVKNRTGLEAIDGDGLQQSLLSIVNSLGAGYQFMGVATPETTLGTPDQKVFWIAYEPGTYSNGAVIAPGDVCILQYSNIWTKIITGIAKAEFVDKIGALIGNGYNVQESIEIDVIPGQTIVAISESVFSVYGGASSADVTFIGNRPDNKLNAFTYVVPGGMYIMRFYKGSPFYVTIAKSPILYAVVNAINEMAENIETFTEKKVSANDFYGVNPPQNQLYLNVLENGYLPDPGTSVVPSPNYKTSDFIKVDPSQQIALSYVRFSAQYDEQKNAITGKYADHNNAQSAIITTGDATKYIRVTLATGNENAAQVIKGSSVLPYSPYVVDVPFIAIPFTNVRNVSVLLNQINGSVQTTNLFDKGHVEIGYIDSDGSVTYNPDYRTSPFIPVEQSQDYALGYARFVCQYDSVKQIISGTYADKNNAAESQITTTANTAYIRVTVEVANTYRGQVNVGTSLRVYQDFGYKFPELITSKGKFDGKKAVCFGDSITAHVAEMDKNNWCMYLKNATGMDVVNQGYWSGRVAYSDDSSAVINAFAFYKLVDAIISGDWSDQDIVYQTPRYEDHAAQLDKLKQIDFSTVDFLTIALGTNDLASDTPFEIENEPMSVNSVNGAFRYSISKLLTNYPQLHIGIMTPIYWFTPSTGDDYMVNGRGIQSFVDDYKELGKELHIPVCDMFNDIGVNKYNRSYYWGPNGGDGLHPIATMKRVMGNKVAGFLTSVY